MVQGRTRLAGAALTVLLLASCSSTVERLQAAAAVQGEAQAERPFPDLPEACTVKIGRVRPQEGEARVVTLKRWEVVADVRDRQADDCRAWGAEMKANWK